VALISGRAHVDCEHHSEYRYVIKKEIMESMIEFKLVEKEKK